MIRHLANAVSQVSNIPAVYAMYGGRGRGLHVAYVGISDDRAAMARYLSH